MMGDSLRDGRIKDGLIVICYVCTNSTWTTGYSRNEMRRWLVEKKGWIYVAVRRRFVCGVKCETAVLGPDREGADRA